jgi:predicted HTH transcriptional regulator
VASPGWSATLTDLLGAPVGEVTAGHIRQLVTDKVRETDELDFKATLYAKDDEHRIELCKDIAGLRNHRGGVIVMGVGEKDAVANGCPEVDLSDDEERRMKLIVASGTAPHAAFEIRRVPGDGDARGFYLLVAEPSPFRPHAVLAKDGLRYPRRDGTTTRYLSEAEVADLYRDRFRGEKQQTERLAQIAEETVPHLDRAATVAGGS